MKKVFYKIKDIPTDVFSSSQSLGTYLIGLAENSEEVIQLSYFGRELRHLFQNSYNWDAAAKVFVK